jgi:hypothetical protein
MNLPSTKSLECATKHRTNSEIDSNGCGFQFQGGRIASSDGDILLAVLFKGRRCE